MQLNKSVTKEASNMAWWESIDLSETFDWIKAWTQAHLVYIVGKAFTECSLENLNYWRNNNWMIWNKYKSQSL
jgi:hypothetical protein